MSDRVKEGISRAAEALGISEEEFRQEAHLGDPKTKSLQQAVETVHKGKALPKRRPDAYLEVLRHCLETK